VDLTTGEPEIGWSWVTMVGGGPSTSSTTMELTEPVPIIVPEVSNSSRSMLNAKPRLGTPGNVIDLRRVVKFSVWGPPAAWAMPGSASAPAPAPASAAMALRRGNTSIAIPVSPDRRDGSMLGAVSQTSAVVHLTDR
jgi:hypothetical protein